MKNRRFFLKFAKRIFFIAGRRSRAAGSAGEPAADIAGADHTEEPEAAGTGADPEAADIAEVGHIEEPEAEREVRNRY